VRLDEWQQYLESQFVEEASDPRDGASGAPARRRSAEAGPTEISPALPDEIWCKDEPVRAEGSAVDMASQSASEAGRSAVPPDPAAESRPPSRLPSALPDRVPNAEAADLDVDFPDFAGFVPSRYRSSPAASDPAGVRALSAQPILQPEAVPAAPAPLPPTPQALTPAAPAPADSPASVSGSASDRPGHERPEPAARAYSGPPRRSPARRAKNVRANEVAASLSAAELWTHVPQHVQTLLALERQGDTAQSSYKRAFGENRQELIERLLDPILSLEETARLLNVCPTTVRRYTNRGLLNSYRKEPVGGTRRMEDTNKETRQRRFRLSDVLLFLEAQGGSLVDAEAHGSQPERRDE
jgi:hypothetical protein